MIEAPQAFLDYPQRCHICKIYKKNYLKTIYNAKNMCYNDTVYYSCFAARFDFFRLKADFYLKGRDVRVGAEAYIVRFQ